MAGMVSAMAAFSLGAGVMNSRTGWWVPNSWFSTC